MKEEMVCIQYTYVCVVSYEVLDTRVPMRKKYTKGMKTSIIPFYGNFLFLITCMKFHFTICETSCLKRNYRISHFTFPKFVFERLHEIVLEMGLERCAESEPIHTSAIYVGR